MYVSICHVFEGLQSSRRLWRLRPYVKQTIKKFIRCTTVIAALIEVISGREEARLIYLGVAQAFRFVAYY